MRPTDKGLSMSYSELGTVLNAVEVAFLVAALVALLKWKGE